MTSSSVWKLEDHHSYPTNCFPARGIARKLHEGIDFIFQASGEV